MRLQNRIERLEEKLNDPDRPCPVCEGWPQVLEVFRDGVKIEEYRNGSKVIGPIDPIPPRCPGCKRSHHPLGFDEAWVQGEDEEERLARAESLKQSFMNYHKTPLFVELVGRIELPHAVSIEVDWM